MLHAHRREAILIIYGFCFLAKPFDYLRDPNRPFFHWFEADDGVAGINFADEDEAEAFHGIVA